MDPVPRIWDAPGGRTARGGRMEEANGKNEICWHLEGAPEPHSKSSSNSASSILVLAGLV